MNPPKKLSVQFRYRENEEEKAGHSDTRGNKGDEGMTTTTTTTAAAATTTVKENGRNGEPRSLAFQLPNSGPSSLDAPGTYSRNTLPEAPSRHTTAAETTPPKQLHSLQPEKSQQPAPRTAKTLPRALNAWTASLPRGADGEEKPRGRKPSQLLQLFHVTRDHGSKRARSSDRVKAKSDSETQRFGLHRRGFSDAVASSTSGVVPPAHSFLPLDDDQQSQESGVVKKKKSKRDKFRKRVERMVSLNKDKDGKKLSR